MIKIEDVNEGHYWATWAECDGVPSPNFEFAVYVDYDASFAYRIFDHYKYCLQEFTFLLKIEPYNDSACKVPRWTASDLQKAAERGEQLFNKFNKTVKTRYVFAGKGQPAKLDLDDEDLGLSVEGDSQGMSGLEDYLRDLFNYGREFEQMELDRELSGINQPNEYRSQENVMHNVRETDDKILSKFKRLKRKCGEAC